MSQSGINSEVNIIAIPIPIPQGGTGATSFNPVDGTIYYDGTKLTATATGMAGQVLTSNGVGMAPTYQTSPGSSISITGDTGGAITSGSFIFTGGATGLTFNGVGTTETISGTLVVGSGGTGRATLLNHGVLVGAGTGAITQLAVGTTGQVLTGVTGSDPVFAAPAASSITVTGDTGGGLTGAAFTFTGGATGLTFAGAGTTETLGGILIVSNGGTGRATLTNHGILVGAGTTAITQVAAGTTNTVLLGNTGADPSFGTVSNAALANSSITLTNGTGITVTGSPVSLGGSATIALSTPVAIADGGTNATSMTTADGTIYFDGTRLVTTATGSSGQVLMSAGPGIAPSYQSLAPANISITGDTGGVLTGAAFTFTGGTTGLSFGGSGTTETLTFAGITANGGTVSLATDATTSAINIGTGAGVKTSTFGSVNGASVTNVQSGTGGLNITSTNSALTINSGSGALNISTDSPNTTVNIGFTVTPATPKNVNLGAPYTTSATVINSGPFGGMQLATNGGNITVATQNGNFVLNAGTGLVNISNDASANTVNIGTGAAVKTTTLGSTNSTSTTTVQSGTGALNVTSTNGAMTIVSGTGALNISNDASATTINMGTGAAVKAITLGSTNTTSSTIIKSGSGNIIHNSGFTVDSSGRNFNTVQPAFFAYLSAALTNQTGDNTFLTVPLNATLINQGSVFNTSTNTFTAPIAGNYMFNAQVWWSNIAATGNTGGYAFLTVGASHYYGFFCAPSAVQSTASLSGAAANQTVSGLSILLPLTAGQTVLLGTFVGGISKTVGILSNGTADPRTWMSGYLVC